MAVQSIQTYRLAQTDMNKLTEAITRKLGEKILSKVADKIVDKVLEGIGFATDEILNVEQVSERYGFSKEWVRDHAPQLAGRKVGEKWIFCKNDLNFAFKNAGVNGLGYYGKRRPKNDMG
ncbi:MAG: hypothetical protein K2M87_05050 [Muribaculaceae bacterium]|nr:hypothetical protein [Muribaculaceae bacterium]